MYSTHANTALFFVFTAQAVNTTNSCTANTTRIFGILCVWFGFPHIGQRQIYDPLCLPQMHLFYDKSTHFAHSTLFTTLALDIAGVRVSNGQI